MDRLIDRMRSDDWVNLTDDIENVVGKKIADKINTYKEEFKESGKMEFSDNKE